MVSAVSVPALFTHGNVVDLPAPVEIGCRAQRITAALTDSDLELADIAQDGGRIERYDLAVTLQGVFARHLAQPGEGLAAWPAPQSGSPTTAPTASHATAAGAAVQAR
jgi:hypothetical protein